ncbi:MAG: hypothetical protein ACRDJW_18385 [Thermomicrobiales bacterium]
MLARTVLLRLWLAMIVAGGVLGSGPGSGPLPARAADTAALDGRLGGTLASFSAAYGPPIEINYAIGAIFDVAGYGLVAAQFGWEVVPEDPALPALMITLRAPRPEGVLATRPDPADWSEEDGRQQAERFLPADVTFGAAEPSGETGFVLPCRSEALGRVFGDAVEHRCQASFVTPTPETVSFVTLTLTRGAEDAEGSADDTCAGVAAWARAAGDRMATAAALLAEIEAIDPEDAAAAAEDLERIAGDFQALADDQRAAGVPEAATKAHYYLIGAFSAYGEAAVAARDGLLSGNDAQIDAAVETIVGANRGIARATNAIAEAATDCGLAPGTPIPED